jgi:hypothetical protein
MMTTNQHDSLNRLTQVFNQLTSRGVPVAVDVGWDAPGLAEQPVLAWWLRQRTIVGRRWVSRRLSMGDESGVTKAIQRVKRSRDGKLNQLKQRLQDLNDDSEKSKQADRMPLFTA